MVGSDRSLARPVRIVYAGIMKIGTLGSLGREDERPNIVLAAFVGMICAYLALSGNLLRDGDTAWHVAAGELILSSRSLPTSDPFSYTFYGREWHAHEWLSELIFAIAYRLAEWRGIILVSVLAAGGTLLIVGRELLKWLPVRWAVCLCTVICLLLRPLALARPHMLVWPLLAAWVLVLIKARDRSRAPPRVSLLIMPLWANLHASYLLGLGILAIFCVEALITWEDFRSWVIFAVAAVVTACAGPLLAGNMALAFHLVNMRALSVIDEWRATNIHDDKLFLAFLICCWLLVLLRLSRIHPARILLLGGLSAMSLLHARHQMPFVITAALLLAPLFRQHQITREWRLPPYLSAAAILTLVIIALPIHLIDNDAYPLTALGQIPKDIRRRPVLNGYSFGGPMIMLGLKPYIDGRADMYGDKFTLNYITILRGDMLSFDRAAKRWDIVWTILPPKAPLVSRLDHSPDWRRFYADQWAVVHVRRSLATNHEQSRPS